MRSHPAKYAAPTTFVALTLMAGCLLSPLSQAQQIYRSVGPDGKVTYSDKPPAPDSKAKVSAAGAAGGVDSAGLPFELRQVATKYPVTLYVGDNCAPCGAGRSLLTSRGIPFTEKTVNTNEDSQALQRLSGDTSLPFLTIGSQQLKGFSDSEWTQFLNAAGYPPSSVLPSKYRPPAATPLVTATTAPAAAAGDGATARAPASPPTTTRPAPPPNDNPAGIKF